ncbi:MAG: FAD-binding protein [Treponema sp.]
MCAINEQVHCDVCVAGAGLAGVSAAIAAAEQGCSVLLLSLGNTLSGSSFFPGSWGLGLIAPASDTDQESLLTKILEVGCGMAEPPLARVLVQHIGAEIERLAHWGIAFRMPEGIGTDRTLIPCFDDQYRMWRGLLYPSMTAVFQKKIQDLGIRTLAGEAALQTIGTDGTVRGLLTMDSRGGVRSVYCHALVLATGGMAGLFRHKIPTNDISCLGQAIALEAGAALQNIEFMQFIPAYIKPAYQTIFNERTFKFAQFCGTETSLLEPYLAEYNAELRNGRQLTEQAVLEERSGHGPFSSRLPGKLVDFMLYETHCRSGEGVPVRFTPAINSGEAGMMINDYFAWLEKTKGISTDTPVYIAPFFHASNGGIKIDISGSTGIPGLFACGECSSGMHGADRIGGLSTANSLVFGRRAGSAAAEYALDSGNRSCRQSATEAVGAEAAAALQQQPAINIQELEMIRTEMQTVMYDNAAIIRTAQGLESAAVRIRELRDRLRYSRSSQQSEDTGAAVQKLQMLTRQLLVAEGMIKVMLARRESRGSHYRADYPHEDETQSHRIMLRLQAGEPVASSAQ